MNIENKKIGIIGAIRSGIGAAKLVKKLNGIPFVSDASVSDKVKELSRELDELGISYETGEHTDRLYENEIIVVSPGVPLDAPVVLKAKEKNIKVISEIELASMFCKGKIIAITGTNGKTTTTALINHVINACGYKAYEAGNIGKAFSEIVLDIKEDEFVSLEVSSFQLDTTENFKPDVALILNITPDHLNRYDYDFSKYIDSKQLIYRNQDASNRLVTNYDDEVVVNGLKKTEAQRFLFSLSKEVENGCSLVTGNIVYKENNIEKFKCTKNDISLVGEHNYQNVMAAICALKKYDFDNEKIIEGLRSFEGVEHRLEFVRELDGVRYINDSKATNIDSLYYALKSFENPILLILGGQDVGNDYNKIKDLIIEHVKKIYAIGSSAEKIFNFFHKDIKVEIRKTMEEAVNAANHESRSGDIVLLSPACKSFDMYTSYEHRGKVFKEAVNNL